MHRTAKACDAPADLYLNSLLSLSEERSFELSAATFPNPNDLEDDADPSKADRNNADMCHSYGRLMHCSA